MYNNNNNILIKVMFQGQPEKKLHSSSSTGPKQHGSSLTIKCSVSWNVVLTLDIIHTWKIKLQDNLISYFI